MLVAYCATGKSLQSVLLLVKEVSENMLLCLSHIAFLNREKKNN